MSDDVLSDANTLTIIDILKRIIHRENGFHVVIECLSCWQDVIGGNYCLEPIANELIRSSDPEILLSILTLINRLLQCAPNAIAKFRIHHELKDASSIYAILNYHRTIIEGMKRLKNEGAKQRMSEELKREENELNVDARIHELRKSELVVILGRFGGSIDEQIDLWYTQASRNLRSNFEGTCEDADDCKYDCFESDEEHSMSSTTVTPKTSKNRGQIDRILLQLINILKSDTNAVCLSTLETILLSICTQHDCKKIMSILKCESYCQPTQPEAGIATYTEPMCPVAAYESFTNAPKLPVPPPPPPIPSHSMSSTNPQAGVLSSQNVMGSQTTIMRNSCASERALCSTKTAPIPSSRPAPPPPPPPPPLPPLAPPASLSMVNMRQIDRTMKNPKFEIPTALKLRSLPKEGAKLKQIQWSKIPAEKVLNSNPDHFENVWMSLTKLPEDDFNLNFNELETMFSCTDQNIGDTHTLDRRSSRKNESISLLCHKRSFNVSIFLKQFKEGPDYLIETIKQGRGECIGYDNLQALKAIMPDNEEMEILCGFSGDTNQLGIAEQFFLNLMTVNDYDLKLNCLMLKEEMKVIFDVVVSQIEIMTAASIAIKTSHSLRKIFSLLLQIGNFLNANGCSGNAIGFRLNSLWKIIDMKATKQKLTLIQFIAKQDEICVNSLLEELKVVPTAARFSLESIRNDTFSVNENLSTMLDALSARNSEEFYKDFVVHFERSKLQMNEVIEKMERLNCLIRCLARYFCEDEKTFKIEESLKILAAFLGRLRDYMKENDLPMKRRQKLEQHAAGIRKTPVIVCETNSALNNGENFLQSLDSRIEALESSKDKLLPLDSEDKYMHHSKDIQKSANQMDYVSMLELRRKSRQKSDAFLIRNSDNLDDFLNAVEKLESRVFTSGARKTYSSDSQKTELTNGNESCSDDFDSISSSFGETGVECSYGTTTDPQKESVSIDENALDQKNKLQNSQFLQSERNENESNGELTVNLRTKADPTASLQNARTKRVLQKRNEPSMVQEEICRITTKHLPPCKARILLKAIDPTKDGVERKKLTAANETKAKVIEKTSLDKLRQIPASSQIQRFMGGKHSPPMSKRTLGHSFSPRKAKGWTSSGTASRCPPEPSPSKISGKTTIMKNHSAELVKLSPMPPSKKSNQMNTAESDSQRYTPKKTKERASLIQSNRSKSHQIEQQKNQSEEVAIPDSNVNSICNNRKRLKASLSVKPNSNRIGGTQTSDLIDSERRSFSSSNSTTTKSPLIDRRTKMVNSLQAPAKSQASRTDVKCNDGTELSSNFTKVSRHQPTSAGRTNSTLRLPITSRHKQHGPKSATTIVRRVLKSPNTHAYSQHTTKERSKTAMKRTDSCSTASRPALIKTGSKSASDRFNF